VDRLATRAVTLGHGDAYFQPCKALSEYRQGSFPEAVEWAEKALKNSAVFARAKGCAVLAMAQWRLGLKDAARATLNEGNKLAQDISSNQAVDLGDKWLDWLVARILLNEATELIADKSTLGNDSKSQTLPPKPLKFLQNSATLFGIHERGYCFVSCGGARRFQGRRRIA
jgi:tetratricopeptide (TPR) repeat protein